MRWQGPKIARDYGAFGGSEYAHREAYRRAYGPIPEGCEVDHVKARGCRYKDCVEPTHLEAVPHRENTIRGVATIGRGDITHCPKDHEYTPDNVYEYTRPNGTTRKECKKCARDRAARTRQRKH